ncbi:hypothetical protein ACM3NY_18965 [Aeromonas veronii]|uniref:hypothetical protein n=1 Tax=Aeromonas TaxID=642 RepID=UPI002A75DAAB|nr:hypothetical protein [Aeromonas jandaei]
MTLNRYFLPFILFIQFVSQAIASEKDIIGFHIGESLESVQNKNYNFKPEGPSVFDTRYYNGIPKTSALSFLDYKKRYQYVFHKNQLNSIHIRMNPYLDSSPASLKKAIADYDVLKNKVYSNLGIKPELAETATRNNSFFECVADVNCGSYSATFTDGHRDITIFLMGEDDLKSGYLGVILSKHR